MYYIYNFNKHTSLDLDPLIICLVRDAISDKFDKILTDNFDFVSKFQEFTAILLTLN